MLCISRVVGERVRLRVPGVPDIWLKVLKVESNKVRLGFDAPRNVEVLREELTVDDQPIRTAWCDVEEEES